MDLSAIEDGIRQKLFSDKHPQTSDIGVVTVTPEMAEHFLTYTYEGQRNTDHLRVQRYVASMQRGEWRGGDGLVVIGVRQYGFHLIAGKHRMEAVAKSGCTVSLRIEWRRYDSDTSMDEDYVSSNSGKAITREQSLITLGTADLLGVPKSAVNSGAAAAILIANGFANNSPRGANMILNNPIFMHEVLTKWSVEMYAYNAAISHASKKEYKWYQRAAVMAVGLVTFRYQPERAEDFWRVSATNDGLRKGTPEHTLHTFLSVNPPRNEKAFSYAFRVSRAWNACYRGASLSILQSPREGSETPIVIDGSPWGGKNPVNGLAILEGQK